jgi:hypothetical protein
MSVTDAKAEVVKGIRDGLSVADAMRLVERAPATYLDWRKHDATFAAQVDAVREVARAARSRANGGRPEVPDFPEFVDQYLNQPLPLHHERIWDVLQGREPRDMHPSIRYQVGRKERVLITLPPWHAKTQVWTVSYCLWRMCKDPNVRIAVVSQTQEFAKKIIRQIKQYLELPQYAKLQSAFMPEGGWKGDSWTKTAIYLAGNDVAQKDPTLQALGLNGQIYGSRLDVILCDDLVTSKNAHMGKELADWIGAEVANRMDEDGVLHMVGTRMGANDVYSILRDQEEWNGEPVWTTFSQPAVFEAPDPDPSTWVTLWPSKWPGPALAKLKAEATEARWQLTYQQMDAAIDQVFPAGAVHASIDGSRASGPIKGLYTVLGVDPAASGFTAMIVMGLDRDTGRRYVLDGFNLAKCPPEMLLQKIEHFVRTYNCREAVIEKNAFQGFITNLASLRDFMFAQGCLLNPHQTGSNKWDSDLGVASMSPLFLSCADHDLQTDTWTKRPTDKHLISLPNPKFSGGWLDALTTQLINWQPLENKRAQSGPTDTVMALWMANLGIQKELDKARNRATHLANEFLPRMDYAKRNVVNLAQMIEAKRALGSDLIYDFGGSSRV